MDPKKYVLTRMGFVALGQAVGIGVVTGIFALLGKYDISVPLGGLVGALVAILNFLFMAIGVSAAADRATQQDAKGGKAMIKGSYAIRTIVMFVILFACAKSGWFNVIALVVPLLLVRPTLTLAEFFAKKGE